MKGPPCRAFDHDLLALAGRTCRGALLRHPPALPLHAFLLGGEGECEGGLTAPLPFAVTEPLIGVILFLFSLQPLLPGQGLWVRLATRPGLSGVVPPLP